MASSGKKLNGTKSEEVARVTRSSGVKRSIKKIIEEEEEAEPVVNKAVSTKSVKRKLASPVSESDSDLSIKEESDDDFIKAKAPKRSSKKKKVSSATSAGLGKEQVEEKPKKNKKNSSTAAEKAPKAEFVVADIKIPSKGEVVVRPTGPSPYNGTIQFTNKVYLGAHISAAGINNNCTVYLVIIFH
jgi:DNA-binding FrmR family transcriptional regulator